MRLLGLLLSASLAAGSVVVETPFGEVEGFEYVAQSGVSLSVFLGVPYAQAPVGERRFKKSLLVQNWAPDRVTATEFGASCMPFHKLAVPSYGASEDCLFVNIVSPDTTKRDLPVFVFIHGGAYEETFSREIGYKKFAETIAAKGIVVVTIQYRLGPFGFISLGDSVVPGNVGLWDQTLALQFLQKVLPSFGGDPTRVTVSGESAGAFSTSALQFSPHSRDLFNQSFLMSGSIVSELALSHDVVGVTEKLVAELRCRKTTSEEIIECLQKIPADDILNAVDKTGSTRYHPNFIAYQPRIDGDFFPDTIDVLIKQSPRKHSVMGVAEFEAALLTITGKAFVSGLTIEKEDWSSFTREKLVHFITDVVATEREHGAYAGAFQDLLIDYYIGNEDPAADWSYYLEKFVELNSDLMFVIPMYHEGLMKLEQQWPTWLYLNEHKHRSFSREHLPIDGAYHADELIHFTDNDADIRIRDPKHPEDEEFGRIFVESLAAFVKNGDPSSPTFNWPRITDDQPFVHAAFSHSSEIRGKGFRSDAINLWLRELPAVVPIDILRKTRLPAALAHGTPYEHIEL